VSFLNYYAILKIPRNSSKEEIKKAFRALALKLHPDVNKDPSAHEDFIALNEAYLILYDDDARDKYNKEYDKYFNVSESTKNKKAQDVHFKVKSDAQRPSFEDETLNDWSIKAKKQAKTYANMSFDSYSKLLGDFVKDTGFHVGNSLLVFLGLILIFSGAGNLFLIFSKGNNMNLVLLGLLLLLGGFLILNYAKIKLRNKSES
jgi:curved DNA-binding protein CbpA